MLTLQEKKARLSHARAHYALCGSLDCGSNVAANEQECAGSWMDFLAQ